jgi:hypothetical protein
MNERFMMSDTGTKPTIAPPVTAPPSTRPFRPVPTKRPSEREKTKPMAEYNAMIDLFFEELENMKDTPEGQEMIKNLHDKYAK